MSLSYQKELPVFRKVDVVVAGAGSAAWALPVWSALS